MANFCTGCNVFKIWSLLSTRECRSLWVINVYFRSICSLWTDRFEWWKPWEAQTDEGKIDCDKEWSGIFTLSVKWTDCVIIGHARSNKVNSNKIGISDALAQNCRCSANSMKPLSHANSLTCFGAGRSDEEKRRDVYDTRRDTCGINYTYVRGSQWKYPGERIRVPNRLDRVHGQTHDALEPGRHAKVDQLLAGRLRLAQHRDWQTTYRNFPQGVFMWSRNIPTVHTAWSIWTVQCSLERQLTCLWI